MLTNFLNIWFVAGTTFPTWTSSTPGPSSGCSSILWNLCCLLQAALLPLLLLQVSEVWGNSSNSLVLLNLSRFCAGSDFIFGSSISSLVGECLSGRGCAEQGGTELFNNFRSFWIKLGISATPECVSAWRPHWQGLRANNGGTLLAVPLIQWLWGTTGGERKGFFSVYMN